MIQVRSFVQLFFMLKKSSMTVKDIMTKKVFFVQPGTQLNFLSGLMDWNRIRHVPVVDGQRRLIGLVTHRDLLNACTSSLGQLAEDEQRKIFQWVQVKEIMQTNVITISPQADLGVAARIMLDKKIGCLPVIEDEKLVGIVTEADFIQFVEKFFKKDKS